MIDSTKDVKLSSGASYKFFTFKDGDSSFSTSPTFLPYGTYTIFEKQGSNSDYVVDNTLSETGITFTISEDMQYYLMCLESNLDELQNLLNERYATQIANLNNRYNDGTDAKHERTVSYELMEGQLIENESAKHGVAFVKYDADDYSKASKILQYEEGDYYPEPQGDSTLIGAVYEIYNRNNGFIMIDTDNDHYGDTKVEKDEVCATLKTTYDEATHMEYACTNTTLLPNGDYEIIEKTPSVGYGILERDTTGEKGVYKESYKATADGQYFLFTNSNESADKLEEIVNRLYPITIFGTHNHEIQWIKKLESFKNPVQRGKLSIKKNDADRKEHTEDGVIASENSDYGRVSNDNESKYAQGDASFDKAMYDVYNLSNHYVYTFGSNEGTIRFRCETGKNTFKNITGINVDDLSFVNGVYEENLGTIIDDETADHIRTEMKENICYTLTTDIYGNAETNEQALPYGTYLVLEKIPSTGYLNSSIRGGEVASQIDLYYRGELQSLEDEFRYDGGNVSYIKSRLGYNKNQDFCVNGFAFRSYLEKNQYYSILFGCPELVGNIERLFGINGMCRDYFNNSKYYCIEYLIPMSEVIFDMNYPPETDSEKTTEFLCQAILRLYDEWRGSSFECDENLILRLSDDAMINPEWFVAAEEV